MRRHRYDIVVFFSCIFFIVSCSPGEQEERRPNILILLADQWRAQAVGYAGDNNVKTPNIDLLAAGSANFQYAISGMPVCTPFRASLLTGQRPLTHGLFMNDVRLDTSAVTIAEVLAANGYQTGYIGKWHLDGQYRLSYTPPGPRRQGFAYWKAVNCTHDYNHSAYYANDDSTRRYWKGYDAIAQTQDAKKYISTHAKNNQPFFLTLSWGTPHAPYLTAPEEYRKMYDPAKLELRPNVPDSMEQQVRRDLAGYYAHMSALDDMIGELIQKLKDEGVFGNTIIVFTADHGELIGSHGHYKKQRPYDESIRVPMLFHYAVKNGIKSGTYDAMINSEDIMPTLLGLSRVRVPETVEGADFSKYIRGEEANSKDTAAIFTCVQPFGQWARAQGGKETRGIRTPRYTYVRDLNGPWLFFDNAADPYQMQNLVGNATHLEIQKQLNDLLNQKLRETNDEFLPGVAYLEKYNYPPLDNSGTVPYHHR